MYYLAQQGVNLSPAWGTISVATFVETNNNNRCTRIIVFMASNCPGNDFGLRHH